MSDFKIKDKVTSVLNPDFLGIITTAHDCGSMTTYAVSYFKDGKPCSGNFYGFELAPAPDSTGFGFNPPSAGAPNVH